MRVIELAGFVTLSGALHVAALTIAPIEGGGSSGGAGGTADVTLQAANPTLAALVADWDRPPEVGTVPELSAPTLDAAPDRPVPESAAPKRVDTALAAPAGIEATPRAETRLPAPPVPFAQPAPEALPVPDLPRMAAQVAPEQDTRPRLSRPDLTAAAPLETALPQVDTAAPSGQHAPDASLRPEERPTARPKPAHVAPQPAQKARGSGSQKTATAAPVRQKPAASGPSKARLAQLEQHWGAQITSALRRAHRPPNGRASGTVRLVLALTPAGQVAGVSMVASSGDARLDQAALSAVKRARFPRAPEGLTKASYRFSQRLTVTR